MADAALIAMLPAILDANAKWLRGEKGGSRAHLARANLAGANLEGANLAGANLARANLADANLADADLARANLAGANGLDTAKGLDPLPFGPVTLPDGTFRAYKLARGPRGERVVVTLEIPEDAQRVAPLVGRKCRASKARVLALSAGESATSWHADGNAARTVTYRVGAVVEPDKYDPSPFVECSSGLHFFISRREAEEYE